MVQVGEWSVRAKGDGGNVEGGRAYGTRERVFMGIEGEGER
jgi:hypothetical protein